MFSESIVGPVLGCLFGAAIMAGYLRIRATRLHSIHQSESAMAAREAEVARKELATQLDNTYRAKEMELQREIARREEAIRATVSDLERQSVQQAEEKFRIESQQRDLIRDRQEVTEAENEAEKLQRRYRQRLHEISELNADAAREEVLRLAERECEREILDLRRTKLGKTENEVADEARRVLLAAMQRITGQPMNDATATVVTLPSEEMKGRIIGREGRNIRTFEHATGTTLMIDETPDSVLISCFDPVRREIARIALEALLRDGRIHPSSIEDEVLKAEEEMHANVIEFGEGALRRLRLHDVHPEVVALLGKLHYRLSNNQNTLAHSVEVANLCALIASEIGLDPTIAKRAGLFHDLGKAVNEEYEGSHAIVGADIIRQHGEDERIVNATAAHHKEVPAESAYAGLVMVADALSAVRPGARASSMDGFIQRVRSIEAIAAEQEGVVEAYAVQAGREVRVIVEPEKISDEGARKLARSIRMKIEEQLNYPGTVEITVIREQRYTETAV